MAGELNLDQNQRIRDALAIGHKIQAIKIYREATGCGLREAKEFIEALIPELKEREPEKYGKLSENVGCLSAALICLGLMTAVLFFARGFLP